MTEQEKRREKARNMRYKKPLVRDLNLEEIQNNLFDMYSACEEIGYMCTDDESFETLTDALDGDEEEAYEFRMMFSELSNECEMLSSDLDECWVPDCFDKFFVAVAGGNEMMGWDSYEQDYYPIDGIENEWAVRDATKQLKRMTKDELIEAAKQCFKVYQSYVSLKYRYDCLEASMEIIREKNNGIIKTIKEIEALYEQANADSDGFKYCFGESIGKFERLIRTLPQECWIQ